MLQLPGGKSLSSFVFESVGFLLLFVFLQFFCEYYWYPVGESNGLFLYTADYFFECLAKPAGLLTYAGAFLSQFFVLPYCGALLLTLLCLAVYKTAQALISSLMPASSLPLFPLLLVGYTILLHIDADYHLSGTLALIACMNIVRCYLRLEGIAFRLTYMACLAVFSWLFGPATVVAALLIGLIEMSGSWKKVWTLAVALLAALLPLAVWYMSPTAETAAITFLPNVYFNHYMLPSNKIWYPWVVLVLMALTVILLNRMKQKYKFGSRLAVALQVLVAIGVFVSLFVSSHSAGTYRYLQVEHLRKTQDWEQLERMPVGENSPSIAVNAYNLAVQQMGQLSERAFIARRYGPGSLYTPYAGQPMLADLLSDIYFAHGNIAMSQKLALNYMLSHEDALDGRSLLRLIDTNILLGNSKVAEKYIKKLEQTWLYSDAAATRRPLLHDAEALAADSRLGALYRCVPRDSSVVTSVVSDLEAILRANPDYKPARDFLDIYNKLLDEYNQTHE